MMDLEAVFQPGWDNSDSLSGSGSSTKNTNRITRQLGMVRSLCRPVGLRRPMRINDVGCGDLMWAQKVFYRSEYHGFDVCTWPDWPALRESGWDLQRADAVEECLPDADLTIVRDVMIHLPNEMGVKLIKNVETSSRWLLATTYVSAHRNRPFTNEDRNARIKRPTRQYARLDLRRPPFNLGDPLFLIPEYLPGKYMGLWDLHPQKR
jgi:hypothetical protein